MNKRCLVVYFSVTGRTKAKSEIISNILDADLLEIKPKIPYSSKDLNWNNKNSRCSLEHKNKTFPEILNKVENFNDYDIIFVGYPIWWWSAPNIVKNFMKSYDFSGKTIVPFSTSGGGIIGSDGKSLHKFCSKDTKWVKGKLLNSSEKNDIENWIKKLDI